MRLQQIKEDAAMGATSANSVASNPFTSGIDKSSGAEAKFGQRAKKWSSLWRQHPLLKRRNMVGKTPIIRYQHEPNYEEYQRDKVSSLQLYEQGEQDFNLSDAMSRINASEKFGKNYNNSIVYGLEDDDGNIVKVYIQADQADDFEAVLSRELDTELGTQQEIAELLYNLKDQINIVNVVWPNIEEDQEDTVPDDLGLEGGEGGELGAEEGGVDLEGEGDLPAPDATGEMNSTLQQIVDVLKAQAEAQKAEADAKKEQARAEEARYAAQAAESKIKGEEEVLDMEAHFKKQGDEDKESRKLARMAQFRHEVKDEQTGGVTDMGDAEEQEEKTMSMRDLKGAKRFLDYLFMANKSSSN